MASKSLFSRVLPDAIEKLRGPLQRPVTLAYIISLISAVVTTLLILGSIPFASMNNSREDTIILFGVLGVELWLAYTALLTMRFGKYLVGRLALLVFAILVFLTVAIGLGPGVGGDIVGSTAVLAVPFLIFSRFERVPLYIGSILSVVAVIVAQVVEMNVDPIIPLTTEEMMLNRIAAVIVACLVGAFVIYLHLTAEEAKDALASEKARSDKLLLNILPPLIAERLKSGETLIADQHDSVTVLFADIAGFTRLSSERSAAEIVKLLDELFVGFDKIMQRHGLEKIKTIGDGYMAACGVPAQNKTHCLSSARAALEMIELVKQQSKKQGISLGLRVGLHSGPIVAGVIGTHKFSYDLWGDTVNTASRMESASENLRVNVSQATHDRLKEAFDFEPRGEIEMKGKGAMACYFLLGEKKSA